MFTGESFLATANLLLTHDDEAAWRSAISRAYYAAFWTARDIVEMGGVSAPRSGGEGSHDSLWDMLVTEYNASGDSIGEAGRNLKLIRVRADYRPRPVARTEAQRSVQIATRLVADLRALT
jgi:uncharacterized protein (UPF0332 family)